MRVLPKKISFIELDVCNHQKVTDEIVRGETTVDKSVAITERYAGRNFYMIEILNIENELYYHVYYKDNGVIKYD